MDLWGPQAAKSGGRPTASVDMQPQPLVGPAAAFAASPPEEENCKQNEMNLEKKSFFEFKIGKKRQTLGVSELAFAAPLPMVPRARLSALQPPLPHKALQKEFFNFCNFAN